VIRRPPHLRDEHGSVLVMFALLLPALLLVFALAIDVGNWFTHHRHLQMQADAAALAGGAYFGDCFSPDAQTAHDANSTIIDRATAYAGNSSRKGDVNNKLSIFNLQVGGGAARVTTLFNKTAFADGTAEPAADPTETQPPCQTPHLMLDVKQTEQNVPYILGDLIDLISGSIGTHVVPAINARARVQLKQIQALNPTLPLAVPDVNPQHVVVTFVDENASELTSCVGSSTAPLVNGTGCTFDLQPQGPSGAMRVWQGLGTVQIPAAPKDIGMRVGIGTTPGSCGGITNGTGLLCFDYTNSKLGLVRIRDYSSGSSAVDPNPPVLDGVTPIACSTSPFASEVLLVSGSTACPGTVSATVDFGTGAVNPTSVAGSVTATLGNGQMATLKPTSYDAARHAWIFSSDVGAFSLPTANAGRTSVSVGWAIGASTRKVGKKACPCTGSFTDVQSFVTASEDLAGPVKIVKVEEDAAPAYSLEPGAHPVTITVGLRGNLQLATPTDPTATLLRLASTSGSHTQALDCGTVPGHSGRQNDFYQQVLWGCANQYAINDSGICPDAGADQPDCVPVATGDKRGPLRDALNDRFGTGAACVPNNYPTFKDDDPRIVNLVITNFGAFNGNGGNPATDIPVATFASFYVTGWDGSNCHPPDPTKANESYPGVGSSQSGDVWGHFIKYVGGGTPSSVDCSPSSLTPCTPALVK